MKPLRGTVLLVEDQDAHHDLIVRGLEVGPRAWEVLRARTLAEARRLLEDTDPDLVLLDWMLPDGEGSELLPGSLDEALRPYVVMTSHGSETFAVEAVKSGALDYIVKSPEVLLDLGSLAERVLREWRQVVQRRRAEDDLRQLDERYRDLIESASDVIFTTDAHGRVENLNRAFEALLGARRSHWTGRSFLELVHPDDRKDVGEVMCGTLGGTNYPLVEWRVPAADGEPRIVEWRVQRQCRAGAVVGVYGVGRDLTIRKRLEAELRQAQKMEAVGRLAGGIAHDFNNVLTAILGCNEILLLGEQWGAEDRVLMERVRDSGWRAKQLIDQLQAFGRRQSYNEIELDLNVVLDELQKMLLRLIGEDIDLRVERSPGLGVVRADRGIVEQWVMNLVVNARDAMPEGGSIVLSARNADIDATTAAAHPDASCGPHVVLTVSDTGEGIPEEIREHVFEPFFTTKAPGVGTGLGLSTVHGMVLQSGGFITFATELGRGTTFSIHLPRVDAEVAVHRPATREILRPLIRGNETILLIEDEEQVREVARRGLTQAGYDVLVAGLPEDAIALAEAHEGPIHLILSDVVMPGMSGPEVCARLTRIRPNAAVLFMSGYPNDALARHGLTDQDVNLIRKPFALADLTRRIAAAIASPMSSTVNL